MAVFWTLLSLVALFVIVGVAIWLGWRFAKGHTKLQTSRLAKAHEHFWSPWTEHEAALYNGPKLVRYAPGQLRVCQDMSCNAEDIRLIGGQTISGEKDV